jgi:hypothetical protein
MHQHHREVKLMIDPIAEILELIQNKFEKSTPSYTPSISTIFIGSILKVIWVHYLR